MRISTKFLLLLLSLTVLVFAGCSGDDDNPTGSNNNGGDGVNLSSVAIDIPAAMAAAAGSNTGAATAQAYLQLLNSFSAYNAFLMPPSSTPAKIAADVVHTWTDGNLTVTLTIQDTGSEIAWEVKVDGNDGEANYSDFVLLDGYQEKDVASGMLSVYEPTKQNNPVAYWSWSTDPEGMFSSTFHDLAGNSMINASVTPAGSGSLTFTDGDVLSFSANWIPSGAGSYQIYDSGGSLVDSGTWPA